MPPSPKDRRSLLARFFDARGQESFGHDPEDLDPTTINTVLRRASRVFGPRRYFPTDVQGWDNVPDAPSLVVANHSGGTSIPDAWGLGYIWYHHFGPARPLHILAHDMIFALRPIAAPFSRMGILRADKALALRVLGKHGRDLIVMPGGDVETWRPWRARYELRWSGRKGYARLALQAQVPIVPVACAGAHDTLLVLTDGQRFAQLIGLKKLARANIFPVHLSLPWGLGVGPLPHIPLPVRLRYLIGPPIPPIPLEEGADPTLEQIKAHDASVRVAMQALLDQLRDEAPPRKRFSAFRRP